jgi:hypothetical protein
MARVAGADALDLAAGAEHARGLPADTARDSRAGNRRFWMLSALHAHAKSPIENGFK